MYSGCVHVRPPSVENCTPDTPTPGVKGQVRSSAALHASMSMLSFAPAARMWGCTGLTASARLVLLVLREQLVVATDRHFGGAPRSYRDRPRRNGNEQDDDACGDGSGSRDGAHGAPPWRARPLLSVRLRSSPGKIGRARGELDRSAALAGHHPVGLLYLATCAVLTSEPPGHLRARGPRFPGRTRGRADPPLLTPGAGWIDGTSHDDDRAHDGAGEPTADGLRSRELTETAPLIDPAVRQWISAPGRSAWHALHHSWSSRTVPPSRDKRGRHMGPSDVRRVPQRHPEVAV